MFPYLGYFNNASMKMGVRIPWQQILCHLLCSLYFPIILNTHTYTQSRPLNNMGLTAWVHWYTDLLSINHITVLLHNLRLVESAVAESMIHRANCKVLLGFLTEKEGEGIHIPILFKGQLYIMGKWNTTNFR